MTTIAYKNGILAADTQITEGDCKYFGRKIYILPDGRVYAGAGDVPDIVAFYEFLTSGRKKPPRLKKTFECLLIDTDGAVQRFGKDCIQIPHEDEILTLGSGWTVARTGLMAGLTVKAAVQLAGEIDNHTNSVVDVYDAKTKKLTLAKFPKSRNRVK